MAKTTDDGLKPLSERERAFVKWYFSEECNMNGTEAAERAGYTGSRNSLRVTANRVKKRPHVKAAMDAELARATAGADVSVEKVLIDLENQRAEALEAGNYSAAVKCSELQGKHLKMFTERVEHMTPLENLTTDDLLGLIAEIAEKCDVDLYRIFAEHAAERGVVLAAPGASGPH